MSFEQGFEQYLTQSGLEKSAQDNLREVLATTDPEVLAEAFAEWEKSAQEDTAKTFKNINQSTKPPAMPKPAPTVTPPPTKEPVFE